MPTNDLLTDGTVSDVVTDVVKKKRQRPDRAEFMSPHCEPGETSAMLSNILTISKWPPIDTNDPDQISARIDQYHQFCIDNDIKPDLAGVALAIGVTRKTLWCWENGVDSNKPQSIRNLVKKAREINEIMLVEMMQRGKINPIPAIFLLKNNHGYKDQQEVVVTPNTPLHMLDAEHARENIIEALPEETE